MSLTPRARLNMSHSSTDSAMDIDFSPRPLRLEIIFGPWRENRRKSWSLMLDMDISSGSDSVFSDADAAGMDGRESTRIRTPKRFRSASSPFATPDARMVTDSPKFDSPLSPLIGSSPRVVRGQQSLQNCGFKVVRKRRATHNEAVVSKISDKLIETPKRRRPSFQRPLAKKAAPMTEQDYVLQEDNLVSTPDEARQLALDKLCAEPVVVTDLIKRRSVLPGNDRRPSAMGLRRQNSAQQDSPISFRTKRCLSLCSPKEGQRGLGLRERNRSVNDYNLPKGELNPALMDKEDLTGDFKRMLSLPCGTGKHTDIKYIDHETLVKLLDGKHPDVMMTIVDARYPYEFKGGHIKGAVNLNSREMVLEHFYGESKGLSHAIGEKENCSGAPSKHVIIFHCEFSSERAPKMLRFLRRQDRQRNAYPALDFPEIYCLRDGYKNFFACHPQRTTGSYTPMLDEKFAKECRSFRRKNKTAPSHKI